MYARTRPFPCRQKKNVPKFSDKTGFSLEVAGRTLRYKSLHRIAGEVDGYVATGHHSEDYLETVIVQLIRGGGWNSLRTLKVYENDRLRPLLLFKESDRKFLVEHPKWPVFDDESNESDSFLRNRIRKQILPHLLKEGANPEKIYRNFHDLEIPRPKADRSGKEVRVVSRQVLESETESVCKDILDLHMKSVFLHPLSGNFLRDLLSKIDSRTSFSLENREAWFWKSVSSDLYILPKSGAFFRSFQFDSESGFLRWNGKTKRVPEFCLPESDAEGEKILLRGIHRELSELLREKEIPVPIRKMLPILKRDGKTVMVCLRMWDTRMDDIQSDDFQGAF
ncbi:tRNA(Ile)-lysidine synthetase [Leptospira fluminis]|uniref:tRNA(Ile)-lysidine synthetase n=1 Tax=Leptospira fluminis TaxID=2484979 RepID=A0A4R9GST1_9LEPT|nr:ATP-binding protein [Leptospira fluminis]TGK21292.1 tRNA(Ile)-lysidine synthetase [Leptospira fluminis]